MTDTDRRTFVKAMGVGLVGTPLLSGESGAATDRNVLASDFVASLSPEQVVTEDGRYDPATNPQIRGSARFQYRAMTGLFYRIQVENANRVNRMNIHRGTPEENGPVLVRLYEAERPIERVAPLQSKLQFPVEDWLLRSDARLVNRIDDVEGVVLAMNDGSSYLQIETDTGMIRGQIVRD